MQLIDGFQYRTDMAHMTVRGPTSIEWISEPTVHDIAQLWDDDVHFVGVRILLSSFTLESLQPVETILFEWLRWTPAPCRVRLH